MALDIGTLVGHLQLDGEAFQATLDQADKGMEETASKGEKSTSKLKGAFGSLAKVAGGALAGLSLGSILSKGWDRLTGIENAEAKLKGLGNTADDVKKIMDNAMAAVKGTAFGMDEAATVAASTVAAGIKPGQDLERTLKLVADAAAIAGSDLGEMGQIFNKVATSNKLQGDTIDQLNEKGIPIVQLLAKTLGRTSEEVVTMASKGKIGFADFQKAIESGMSGAAKAAGETTTGALQNLGASASRLGATLLKDVFPLIQGAVTGLSATFDGIGKAVGPAIDWIIKLPAPVKAAVAALTALAALKMLGVFSALRVGIGSVLSPLTSMRMQLAANRELAAATGTRFSAMGSVMRSVGSAAKGFGSSLLGAVGGPGGLLLTGAIVAVTFGLMKQAEASRRLKQIAEEQKTATDNLVQALAEQGGAIDENIRKQATAALQSASWGRESTNLLDLHTRLGVSQRDLVSATLGDANAQKIVTEAIKKKKAATAESIQTDLQHGKVISDENRITTEQIAAYEPRIKSQAELSAAQKEYTNTVAASVGPTGDAKVATEEATEADIKAAEKAKEKAKADELAAIAANYKATNDIAAAAAAERHKDAVTAAEDALKGAQDALTPFAQASKDAGDKQSFLAQQADRVSDALDRQKGILPDVDKATFNVNEMLDNMKTSMGLGTKEVINLGYALEKGTSTIDLTEESGRKLYGVVGDLKKNMIDLGTATFDANVKTKGVKGAQDEAAKSMAGVRAEAVTNLAKIPGMTKEMASKILDEYGIIPTEISTKIGADDTQNKVKAAEVSQRAKDLDKIKSMSKADLDKRAFDTKVNEIRSAQMPKKIIYFTADLSAVYAAMARANAGVQARGYIVARSGITTARAGGGEIDGPGPKGKDSVLALVAPGEHVFTDKEVDALGGQGAVYRLRKQIMAGNIPKFASGGGVPSASSLAGWNAPSYSGREGVTRGALGDLSGWLADVNQASRDAAQAKREEAAAYYNTRVAQAQNVAEAEKERREKLADAKAAIASAKTFAERAAALKDHAKIDRETFANLQKVNAAKAKANLAAKAEYDAATRAASASAARATEANRDAAATARARSMLVSLSRQADQVASNLANARNKLGDLTNARAQMASSVATSIAGSGAGLLGFQDQRKTAADIIRGLTFDKNQIAGFTGNLSRAKSLGLDPQLLEQLASGGLNNSVTASALAGATKAQIAQINSLVSQTNKLASNAGNMVGDANYTKAITAQTAAVKSLDAKIARLNDIDERIARAVSTQFKALTNQGLAVLVAKGQKELARR